MMMKTIGIQAPGHPLRRQLGLNVDQRRARRKSGARQRDDKDFKLFVLSYTAFFICFYTFLA